MENDVLSTFFGKRKKKKGEGINTSIKFKMWQQSTGCIHQYYARNISNLYHLIREHSHHEDQEGVISKNSYSERVQRRLSSKSKRRLSPDWPL